MWQDIQNIHPLIPYTSLPACIIISYKIESRDTAALFVTKPLFPRFASKYPNQRNLPFKTIIIIINNTE